MSKDHRKNMTLIGISLGIALLCAGVLDWSLSPSRNAVFDPRTSNMDTDIIGPTDACYSGYIPDDAVIITTDGFYVVTEDRDFKKVAPAD